MAPTIPDRLADVHPLMLRAELRTEAKAERKELADLRPAIGQLVERAFELMSPRLTKQDAAYRMRYDDPGTVSRWCAGKERPCFDKLFAIPGFKVAYVLAMAEQDPAIDVTTTITIRKVA
jgi:hypothetical protein